MIRKLLIANRGEIACRIARTCREIGLPVATVHSEADRGALHVRAIGQSIEIGAAPARASYLNVDAIVDAARLTGANAVHPGIGFLSEAPELCAAVEAAGLIFVGPRPETLRCFGDKWRAKQEARRAGVPVIEGSESSFSEAAAVEREVRQMRLPVVLKAAAGGGGRGVRVLRDLDGVRGAIESAMREALASFGRPDLLIERFVEQARHVEVQVAGDGQGEVVHLFERECSLQRRFQKVVEEAPAACLNDDVRRALTADSVRLAASVAYRNLGTIEYLVTENEYFFLECNPRLQVEHTVTEEVTGQDLVRLQLHIASHGNLPFPQQAVSVRGHAVQLRVNAERPDKGFVPSTGRILACRFPTDDGVRVEAGIDVQSQITPHYDSLVAKLVVHRETRAEALDGLIAAIDRTAILGVHTNLAFARSLLQQTEVRAGTADNRFIDRDFIGRYHPDAPRVEVFAVAACLRMIHDRSNLDGVWSSAGALAGWRLGDGDAKPPRPPAFLLKCEGSERAISFGPMREGGAIAVAVDGELCEVRLRSSDAGTEPNGYEADIGRLGCTLTAVVADDSIYLMGPWGTFHLEVEPYLSLETDAGAVSGQVLSPMLGTVAKVNVKVGDRVKSNDVLVVIESMKMELGLTAPCDGTVIAVSCSPGQTIERHSLLVEIDAGAETPGEQDERSAKVSHIPRRRAARRVSN